VLKALLPETGTDIRGHLRSREELLEASGYASDPKKFKALLCLLDAELRLVTPTDPENTEGDGPKGPSPAGMPSYQLTHDYLVPALRAWLTRKQRDTRRGRAELRLAEQAALWSLKRQKRYLPSWWEWVTWRLLTRRHDWTQPQRKMMRAAGRYHLFMAVRLVVLALLGWAVFEVVGYARAATLIHALVKASDDEVPKIIGQLITYRRWAGPMLRDKIEDGSFRSVSAFKALLAINSGQAEYVCSFMFKADTNHSLMVRNLLLKDPNGRRVTVDQSWKVLENPGSNQQELRRAVWILAHHDSSNERWLGVGKKAIALFLLMSGDPIWGEYTIPTPLQLTLPGYCQDPSHSEAERARAVSLMVAAGHGPVETLAKLTGFMDGPTYLKFLIRFQGDKERVFALIRREFGRKNSITTSIWARQMSAQRLREAALFVHPFVRDRPLRDLLRLSPDPLWRTLLINHTISSYRLAPEAFFEQFEKEPDASVRSDLILMLYGSRGPTPLLLPKLLRAYRRDPDPGVHSALNWLLRRWGRDGDLANADRDLRSSAQVKDRSWYVNRQGHTLTVVSRPKEFWMGSPPDEPGRSKNEGLHRCRIARNFAIGTKEVTVEQFNRFLRAYPDVARSLTDKRNPQAPGPIVSLTWFQAAQYCRWLSEQEGIPENQMCYPPVAEIKEGMRLPADYLARTGYRLPTEAEWEFACRSGTETSRFFGAADEWLGWYGAEVKTVGKTLDIGLLNPAGSLRPNGLGLFDTYGNAQEWCQDRLLPYPDNAKGPVREDREDKVREVNDHPRVLRGGSLLSPPSELRSAFRTGQPPGSKVLLAGFRVARTCD
jgi:formylglycine-generating enzyme required for sulfatase activity